MVTRRTRRRRGGAAVVETAVVLPLLLVVVFGILEYGRFMLVRQVTENAAREGARAAAVREGGGDTEEVRRRVRTVLAGQEAALAGLSIDVYEAAADGSDAGPWAAASSGDRVAVEVSGTYRPLFGLGFVPASTRVRAKAVMHSEAPDS